jgi:hypothetical protein
MRVQAWYRLREGQVGLSENEEEGEHLRAASQG